MTKKGNSLDKRSWTPIQATVPHGPDLVRKTHAGPGDFWKDEEVFFALKCGAPLVEYILPQNGGEILPGEDGLEGIRDWTLGLPSHSYPLGRAGQDYHVPYSGAGPPSWTGPGCMNSEGDLADRGVWPDRGSPGDLPYLTPRLQRARVWWERGYACRILQSAPCLVPSALTMAAAVLGSCGRESMYDSRFVFAYRCLKGCETCRRSSCS